MKHYTLEQLLNLQQMQSLLEAQVNISGIACGLMDNDQNIVIGAGLQQFCTQFLWKNPESFARCWLNDPEIKQALHSFNGDLFECRCKNGMVNIAMPIVIEGNRLGIFFSGQFFYDNEPPDLDWFWQQAEELGFDVEPYLAVVRQTPLFSHTHVDNTMRFLHQLVQLLAETGYANFQRERELEERKQIERKHFVFAGAINNAIDAFFLIDDQHRFQYVNDAACHSLGYSREELLTMGTRDINPDMSPKKLTALKNNADKHGILKPFETRHRTKDGRFIPVEISSTPFWFDGVRLGLTMARDISQRKQSEQQIKLLNHALDNVHEGAFLLDFQGRFLYVNEAASRSLGYSRDELIGMTILDIDPGFSADRMAEHFAELLDVRSLTLETRHLTRDGQIFPVEISISVFIYGGSSYLLALVRNITERKQAEEDLREREQQFRTLAENLPDNIVRYDNNCRVHYINPQLERTLGKAVASIIGKTPLESSGELFREYQHKLWQVITTGKNTEMDLIIPDTGKGERLHEIRFFAERGADGNVSGVLAIGRDVTERKRIEDMLLQREREFRTLAENLPDNIVRYDSKCRAIYINPEMGRTLGRSAASKIGLMPIEDVGEDLREYQNCIEQVLETGNPAEMELYMPDQGAGVRHHNIRFVAERSADGLVSGVLSIGRDITDRKRAEQERLANLHFLSCMERVNRSIQLSTDLEQMMSDVLDVVLSIFNCDRAYLLYPCDPDAKSWQIPMERTTVGYPGSKDIELVAASNDWIAKKLRLLLYSSGALRLGIGTLFPLSGDLVDRLGIKNILATAIYPKINQPWEFGIHQCSHTRIWTSAEKHLFQEIGRRLSDGMTSLLIHRNLQESEARYRMVFENSPVSLWEEDFSGVKSLFDQLRAEGVENIDDYFDQKTELTYKKQLGF